MAHDLQEENIPALGRGRRDGTLARIDIMVLWKIVPLSEQPVEFPADRRIGPRHMIEPRIGLGDFEKGWARPAADEQAEERVHDRLHDVVVELHDYYP